MIPTALLRQTASIEPFEGESAMGPLFGEAVTAPCRCVPKRRWVPGFPGGDLVASDAVLLLRPDVALAVSDRVTCEGVTYRVLAVASAEGLSRAEFVEAALSRSESE